MLDGNITIDSHGGDMRGCRSIALIGGCSVPEKHYETGVVHVGVVHGNNGSLPLGSICFAVCPSEESASLYSRIWEIDLWNDTSNDCEHDAISSEYNKQNDHATTNASSPDSKVRCQPSVHDNGCCYFITGLFKYLLNFENSF